MPKVSLVLGRRTLNVYDIDRNNIRIGRSPDCDVTIDNEAVSREHVEIARTPDGWIVRDLGSANGSFLNGERLDRPRPLKAGDEISIGKFSVFFGKVMGEPDQGTTRRTMSASQPAAAPEPERPAAPPPPPERPDVPAGGTRFIKPEEIEQLRKASAERRKATLSWEAGGQRGEKAMPEGGTLLVGTSDLCDLKLPKGPKQHLLFSRLGGGWEVRNLAWLQGMKVNGAKVARRHLDNGDTVEIAGATLKYAAAVD